MSVFVDEPKNAFGQMLMCHMLADTPEELHAMADKIGVSRRWFQGMASFPHYDISKGKRAKAVGFGAVEITRRDVPALLERLRAAPAWGKRGAA